MLFFFNDTATTEIYTLSLHDALPIFGGHERPGQVEMADAIASSLSSGRHLLVQAGTGTGKSLGYLAPVLVRLRSEEHTSELQSRQYLVCRLLLEKKNTAHPAVRVSLV